MIGVMISTRYLRLVTVSIPHHIILTSSHRPARTLHDSRLFSRIAEAVERGEADAGVLIHEGRFVYERRNLELVADLGKLWENETNLPLPLGAIIVKREIAENIISKFDNLLSKSVCFALENPLLSRDFVKEHAQELEDDVIEKHISLFVNDYTISLGEEGYRAVERLLETEN